MLILFQKPEADLWSRLVYQYLGGCRFTHVALSDGELVYDTTIHGLDVYPLSVVDDVVVPVYVDKELIINNDKLNLTHLFMAKYRPYDSGLLTCTSRICHMIGAPHMNLPDTLYHYLSMEDTHHG